MPDDAPSVSQHVQNSKYVAQAGPHGRATVNVIQSPSAQEKVQAQNRVRLLARLRFEYERQLKDSLQGAAFITLGLTEKPDAVFSRARLLFLPAKKSERRLEAGTSLLKMYDESKQELLVLGEPGTGKSALLLNLAHELLARAEQDDSHPLPVILPLGSWTDKQTLQDWIHIRFSELYALSPEVSRSLVLSKQVLPLLDGLDEVPQGQYMACMKAIIDYKKQLVPMVVTSRRAEYEKVKREQRLTLHNAVVVESLSEEEVEAYFDLAGSLLSALRKALHTNLVLQELMKTPLMLSIMTLTYADRQAQDVPQEGSEEVQQRQILAAYVKHMIGRRKSWREEQVISWLRSLARMMQQGQSILLVERMQPEWLLPKELFFYRCGVGLVYGLSMGTFGLVFALVIALVYKTFDLLTFQPFALSFGLFWLMGFTMGLFLGFQRGIRPAEHIIWSWKKALITFKFVMRPIREGPFAHPLLGIAFIWASTSLGFPRGLYFCLGVLLLPAFTSLFFGGLSKEQVSEDLPLAPNGGIWRSLRYAFLLGPIHGLILGLISFAIIHYILNVPFSIAKALVLVCLFSIVFSLIGMFIAGLEAFVKHFTLRLVLRLSRRLPLSLIPFLEDMAHCILLRKVGRGYTFPHRLFMEYFAELDATRSGSDASLSCVAEDA